VGAYLGKGFNPKYLKWCIVTYEGGLASTQPKQGTFKLKYLCNTDKQLLVL